MEFITVLADGLMFTLDYRDVSAGDDFADTLPVVFRFFSGNVGNYSISVSDANCFVVVRVVRFRDKLESASTSGDSFQCI